MFDDHTCVLMQVSTNHTRTVIDNTTFCSGGGEAIDPGRDSTEVSCDVVESVKYAVSNPDYLFTSRQKLPMIFALDTVSGLVYSAMILPTGRRVGAEAWAAYRGGWQARVDYTYIYPTWIAHGPGLIGTPFGTPAVPTPGEPPCPNHSTCSTSPATRPMASPGIMSISGRGADRKKAIDTARAALGNQGFTADGDPEVDLKPAQDRHAKLTDKGAGAGLVQARPRQGTGRGPRDRRAGAATIKTS